MSKVQKTNKAASDATIEARVVKSVVCVCWMAWCLPVLTCRQQAIYLGLSGGINQMTVFEIIIAVLHYLSDCVLAYGHSCKCFCELGLCLASNAHEICVRARYCTTSGSHDNRKVTDSAISIAISPNRYEPYWQGWPF